MPAVTCHEKLGSEKIHEYEEGLFQSTALARGTDE